VSLLSRRGFGLGAAALTVLAALPRPARAQARRTLTIGYVPATLFAPVFLAVERGYVRDAGFDVAMTPIVAGADSMALLAQGQFDVAAAALSAAFYNAVNRGLDVKYVASTAYQPKRGSPSALLVREDLYDGGLRRVDGLRGKQVGWIGNSGAASAYYVARILRPAGLRLGDIEPVNVPNPDQEAALERKAIDAVFTSAPFSEEFERRKLAAFVGAPPPGIAASGAFFGPSLLHDGGRARAVIDAFRRAARDIDSGGFTAPANVAACAKYTKQPASVIAASPRYDVKPDLRIDVGTLEDMQREFIADGVLTYKDPIDEERLVARL